MFETHAGLNNISNMFLESSDVFSSLVLRFSLHSMHCEASSGSDTCSLFVRNDFTSHRPSLGLAEGMSSLFLRLPSEKCDYQNSCGTPWIPRSFFLTF